MRSFHATLRHASFITLIGASFAVMVMAPARLHAQTPAAPASDVLGGAALTPDRVLEALDPAAVRTRSFKLGSSGKGVSTAQPARASASLLITFETGSSELTTPAQQQLDIVAAALKNDRLASYRFTVEGHADPRGGSDINQQLSQERADSVKRYLMTRHRIVEDRLVAEGRGDKEPLNRASPAAAENRRVTFVTRQ
jgi:OmpA-OmpF porin, OOP family